MFIESDNSFLYGFLSVLPLGLFVLAFYAIKEWCIRKIMVRQWRQPWK